MSVLSGGQLSTDKLVIQLLFVFKVLFPVWAGIKISSSPSRKLNQLGDVRRSFLIGNMSHFLNISNNLEYFTIIKEREENICINNFDSG